MRLRDALKRGRELLMEKKIGSAFLDAEVILAHVISKNREFIFSHPEYELSEDELNNFFKKISLRERHYPVAYITNSKEFFSLDFFVKEGVLIPRPETELLVEEAINILRDKYGKDSLVKIADLCTGSGAIAISIAYNLKNVFCYASDITELSLEVARENAKRHNVEDRIVFLKGDLWEPFFENNIFDLDIVVSNPPYIPEKELNYLPLDVKYEPGIALNGGPDGLYFYRKIIEGSRRFLKPGGFIILEIGEKQAYEVMKIFKSKGMENLRVKKDFAGLDRVIIASLS
ncbi:peptide chain release factor N(5)-glutamine methyltransferase [Thermovenabulum gondwanense]|uniref:Release factor glutamine methyltransferase n=1 Tax=Thermovenabulum gondwanense TaxID=520767 RepID=A0A162MDZ9_9FIRM|nr:peptide chain release factor N(5)-glutamine methyltransferase [Thermovenabulum gondwanense]KYO65409.1 Release factor glutamine methyltransferase [Thermovenabulum gondwanense]